ncbi:MAG: single-stranded-DNA-specific exonuclease RecJ [Candidatus Babeliales bacterium]
MNFVSGVQYAWRQPNCAIDDSVLEVARRYNVSIPIAQAVCSRGLRSGAALDSYFFSATDAVAHPSLLKDSLVAVERIERAIANKEKILIFGDYDVDGITSSALMMLLLKPLNSAINFFLPHRIRDGYGLSVDVVERAAKNGYTLIITVDNGITAFAPAQRAHELGVDLIITDHHRPHETVPHAMAIVNPHQETCPYPFKSFAGVGVIFKLLSLLYERLGKELPPKAYELLLLGTVADVVPLLGENRYWVRHALRQVQQQESHALRVLKQNGKLDRPVLTATDIGFFIAPQINALGRLEDPRNGVKFLIGTNTQETEQVGKVLLELNQARKEIERAVFNEVVAEIESGRIDLNREKIIMAASDHWPAGVIGLVAGRLMATYGRPTILLHMHNGKAKGSCRSIKEFNMFQALSASQDLLDTFGGHAVAAGLSLAIDKVPVLKQRLEEMVSAQLTPEDFKRKLIIDAQLPLGDLNKKFVSDLQLMEPFGCENPQPLFQISGVTLMTKPVLLKDAHVKCSVFAEGIIKPVIFFNNPRVYEVLNQIGDAPFHLAAQSTENHWQGKVSLELIGSDIALIS